MIPNLVSAGSFLFLLFSLQAHAVPVDPPTPGLTIPLRVRSPTSGRSLDERAFLAKSQRDIAITKYGGQPLEKRSTGYNLYVLFSLTQVESLGVSADARAGSSINSMILGSWFRTASSGLFFC